ncbi:hypothetical protein PPGU19_058100 [Paraburkholderia sp. PGU19]|nr:hypothetical protein PPGU19_058100 [Paraburkholderia sp. PGU19]
MSRFHPGAEHYSLRKRPQCGERQMLIQVELAANERGGFGIRVNHTIVPGQKRIERNGLASLRMHDFMRTATREQD